MVMTEMEYNAFRAGWLVSETLRAGSNWCSGNEFAAIQLAYEAWLMALPAPSAPPIEVRRRIMSKFYPDLRRGVQILSELQAYGSYWGFMHAGMFHGVEPDGYIHT